MASALCSGREINKHHVGVGYRIWRRRCEFALPQLDTSAYSHLLCDQADDIGPFTGPRNILKIVQPDFAEPLDHSRSRPVHFRNNKCWVLSSSQPLSRKPSRKILAGFRSGHTGSANRSGGTSSYTRYPLLLLAF